MIHYLSRAYDAGSSPIMSSNTDGPIPVSCPKCHYEGCKLVVSSATVVTCTCVNCRHVWATEMTSLPEETQQRVREVVNGR